MIAFFLEYQFITKLFLNEPRMVYLRNLFFFIIIIMRLYPFFVFVDKLFSWRSFRNIQGVNRNKLKVHLDQFHAGYT